jgi:hypothetical protein
MHADKITMNKYFICSGMKTMNQSILSFARAGGNVNLSCKILFPFLDVDVTPLEKAVIDGDIAAIYTLKEFSNAATIDKAVELAIASDQAMSIIPILCGDNYTFTYKHALAAVSSNNAVDMIISRLSNSRIDKPACIAILSNPKAGRLITMALPEIRKHLTDNNIIYHIDIDNIQYLKALEFDINIDRILNLMAREIQEHVDDLEMSQALDKIKKYLAIESIFPHNKHREST